MTPENLEQKTEGHLPVKIRLGEYFLNPIYLLTQKMSRVPASEFKCGMLEKREVVRWCILADSLKWVGYTILATEIIYEITKR